MSGDRGVLFIVSSPSGGGKTTLIRGAIAELEKRGMSGHFSISHTTRTARPKERDGIDYYFVDPQVFAEMRDRGAFLEWAEYAGFSYGTSNDEVRSRLERGVDVFLDIEVQGANQVKTQIPEVVKIFIYPPSYEMLKQRLTERRQDQLDSIHRRLKWASREFLVAGEFDYAIINDRLDEAVDALVGIVLAEHHRSERMKPLLDTIRGGFQTSLEKDFRE